MNEHLVKFWLFATHWTELDTFDTEEELNDEIELLHRQNLPLPDQHRRKEIGCHDRHLLQTRRLGQQEV